MNEDNNGKAKAGDARKKIGNVKSKPDHIICQATSDDDSGARPDLVSRGRPAFMGDNCPMINHFRCAVDVTATWTFWVPLERHLATCQRTGTNSELFVLNMQDCI
jgi:hypothetical protein